MIGPGPDGVFEGGDEVLLDQFDTEFLFGGTGLSDPEGIGYHWERDTLFIASRGQKVIAETTITGTLLNTYDFTDYNVLAPSGLGIGPGSEDASIMSVYLSQRGVDNGSETEHENDGNSIFPLPKTTG